jgi:hypothetical protein
MDNAQRCINRQQLRHFVRAFPTMPPRRDRAQDRMTQATSAERVLAFLDKRG